MGPSLGLVKSERVVLGTDFPAQGYLRGPLPSTFALRQLALPANLFLDETDLLLWLFYVGINERRWTLESPQVEFESFAFAV